MAARLVEFLFQRRIHPVISARIAAVLHPIGAAALAGRAEDNVAFKVVPGVTGPHDAGKSDIKKSTLSLGGAADSGLVIARNGAKSDIDAVGAIDSNDRERELHQFFLAELRSR